MRREFPKYVNRLKGVVYFIRRGEPATRMKNQTLCPEFWAEYALLLKGRDLTPSNYSFKTLIASYRKSLRFRKLADRTKADYDKVLDLIESGWGHIDPRKAKRKDFIKLRDDNAKAVRFANYCVQVSGPLMEHCIDIGWRSDNPARGVVLLKAETDPRKPWPQSLIKKYREAATGRELLVFEMCLGTGQRIGDVLKMKWGDIEDDGINVRQNKTGTPLWVPLTKGLRDALSATEKRSVFILTNQRATGPWSYRGASQAVRKVRDNIGALDYDIHALRHTAASELASAGCDDETIAAVTGQSIAMVQHYTRTVRQKVRALRTKGKRD